MSKKESYQSFPREPLSVLVEFAVRRVEQRQLLRLELTLSLWSNCFSNIFERHPVVVVQNRLECCEGKLEQYS